VTKTDLKRTCDGVVITLYVEL